MVDGTSEATLHHEAVVPPRIEVADVSQVAAPNGQDW